MSIKLTKLFSLADSDKIHTCCDRFLITNTDGTVDIWTKRGTSVIRNGQISDGSLYIAQIGNDYTITDDGATLKVYTDTDIQAGRFVPWREFSKPTNMFTQHRKHNDAIIARYYPGKNSIKLCIFEPKSDKISLATVHNTGELVAVDRANLLCTLSDDRRRLVLWTPTGSAVIDACDLLGVSSDTDWYVVQQDAIIKYIGLRGYPGIIRVWITRSGVDAEAMYTDLTIEGIMTSANGDVALAGGRMIVLDDPTVDITDSLLEVIGNARVGIVGGMDDTLVVGDTINAVERVDG